MRSLALSRGSPLLALFCACTGRGGPNVHPPVDDTAGRDTAEPDTAVEAAFADATVSLATDPFPNLLLPYSVAVDSANRRLWVTSLYDDVLGQVDIDDATLVAVYDLPEEEYGLPSVVVDGNGDAWLGGDESVVKVTPTGESTMFPRDKPARNLLGADGGGVYVSSDAESSAASTVELVNGDGEMIASTTVAQSVVALAAGPEGVLALSAVDDAEVATVRLLSSDTLEYVGTCQSPFTATGMFALQNGDFFVISDGRVGYARCDGSDPVSVQLGEENKFAVVHEDGFTVFDRVGEDATGGRSFGIARRLDADLAVTSAFGTGKHSGFGGIDEQTGITWLNSEGTSEVRAYDLDADAQVAAVRLGSHVEGFTVSDVVNAAWVTGRLTGLIARVDFTTGLVVPAVEGPVWPVSPLFHDGVLYALDQIDGVVYVYDAETMALTTTWPLSVAQNDDLDFDDLAFSESRGSLLVAVGQANLLIEVDIETGRVVSRFQLGGSAPPAGVTVGRLEIATQGDRVWVVRSTDSTATLVDLASRQVTSQVLATEGEVGRAQYELVPKLTWLSADGARLYWGPWAFDPLTFDALPEDVLEGTRVIGELDGAFVTWDKATGSVLLGAPGDTAQVLDAIAVTGGDPYARWLPEWGGGVMYVDSIAASISIHDIATP